MVMKYEIAHEGKITIKKDMSIEIEKDQVSPYSNNFQSWVKPTIVIRSQAIKQDYREQENGRITKSEKAKQFIKESAPMATKLSLAAI